MIGYIQGRGIMSASKQINITETDEPELEVVKILRMKGMEEALRWLRQRKIVKHDAEGKVEK